MLYNKKGSAFYICRIILFYRRACLMKDFFKRYSYNSVKLFVNQVAISLLGAGLALATSQNDTLLTVTSVFAIVFYLFLVYVDIWQVGAKDRISIDVNKMTYKPLTGLIIALFANIINFIIAIFMIVGLTMGITDQTAGTIGGIARVVALFLEGMYQGVMAVIKIGGVQIHSFWPTYFIIIIPALATSTLAYIFGHHDMRLTTMMIVKNPEERLKKSKFFDGNAASKDDKNDKDDN